MRRHCYPERGDVARSQVVTPRGGDRVGVDEPSGKNALLEHLQPGGFAEGEYFVF